MAGSHVLSAPMPPSFDVLDGLTGMPAIFDQEQEGSCTANAWIRFLYYLTVKFPKYTAPLVPLSRQGLYYLERALPWNNSVAQDSGANMRDGAYVLTHTGAFPETLDAYQPSTIFVAPNPAAIAAAAQRRFGAYHRLTSVDDFKGCLLSGYPIAFGFTVYESFEDVGPDGIFNPNVLQEQIVGGHATFLHGYDDAVNGGSFIVDNSWGPLWGKKGSFYVPYSFLRNYGASQWDSWTAHWGPPWVPKALVH